MKKIYYLLGIILVSSPWLFGQTSATDAGTLLTNNSTGPAPGGTFSWSSPTFPTSAVLPGSATEYTMRLYVQGFGFTIPTGALGTVIDGIEVSMDGSTTSPGCSFLEGIQLIDETGALTGSEKYPGTFNQGTWPNPNKVEGSSADLWGGSWSVTKINDPDFGVSIQGMDMSGCGATLTLTNVSITVYYTELLPVVWGTLELKKSMTREILFDWSTMSEVNSNYFSIERAGQELQFTEIGKVDASGNTNEETFYSFTDKGALNGTNIYRLAQVDFDGEKHLSPSVEIVVMNDDVMISMGPNPVNDILNIIPAREFSSMAVEIFSMDGRKISVYKLTDWKSKFSLDLSENPKGTYIVKLSGENFNYSAPIIKN